MHIFLILFLHVLKYIERVSMAKPSQSLKHIRTEEENICIFEGIHFFEGIYRYI